MKVTNSTVQGGIPTTRSEALEKKGASRSKAARSGAGGAADRVELSVSREKIDRLTQTVAAMESGNAEKIQSIKEQIASGTYSVSGRAVAEKMLRAVGIAPPEGDA